MPLQGSVEGKQCACGAIQGGRETGSPAATTCFFCFAIRVFWRLRRYILLISPVGALHAAPAQASAQAPRAIKTMRLRRYTKRAQIQWRPQGAPTCFLFPITHHRPRQQSSKMTLSSLTPPRAERDWWGHTQPPIKKVLGEDAIMLTNNM